MITIQQYFKKMSDLGAQPTQDVIDAATVLLKKVNDLINDLRFPETHKHVVSSGWRTLNYNKKIGGATYSNHVTGHAIDIASVKVGEQVSENLLIKHGLFMENPVITGTWTHLQDVTTKSGRRIFMP
jgi:uncharacterized protein YcbK (DUF882 family)